MKDFTFATPGRLVVEWEGSIRGRLAEEAKRLGTKPLVVAGSSLVKNGMLDAILASLHKAGLSPIVHTGVPPEPDLDALQTAMNAAEDADSVIAIGGGSVLDVAKGAAALAGTGHSAQDYHRGTVPVPEAVNRSILAVPTTAGTGSEATWVGVFTDKEAGRKASIRGGAMMPQIAFLDAALTVSCPPTVIAYSGLDAVVQAIESYMSSGANWLTWPLAMSAISLTADNLQAIYQNHGEQISPYQNPHGLIRREAMLMGSYMAGVALNTSRLGLVHGLAHPIGALTGAPHGLLCGLLMPAVTRFNAGTNESYMYEDINARMPDSCRFENAKYYPCEAVAQQFELWLKEFGIPTRLSEIGLREEHIDIVVQEALLSGSTKANPGPVIEADIRAIVHACM